MVYVLLILNSLIMIALPIILGIWLARRYKVGWSLFFIGVLGFIASQVGHIPFNAFVLNPLFRDIVPGEASIGQSVLTGIVFGLSAGVFEEVVRYLFYRWRKNAREWEQGLMFGAGWGGIEAISFGVLAALGIVNLYLYQSGMLDTLMPPDQAAAQADSIALLAAQVEALMDAPRYTLILGAVERLFAITLHLAMSIMVLQAVIRKNIGWLLLAIGWHTLIDAIAVFALYQGWDALLIEAAAAVLAVISLVVILALRRTTPSPEPDPTPEPAV